MRDGSKRSWPTKRPHYPKFLSSLWGMEVIFLFLNLWYNWNVFIVPMRDGRMCFRSGLKTTYLLFLSSLWGMEGFFLLFLDLLSTFGFYRPYEGWKVSRIASRGKTKIKSFYRPYEGWKALIGKKDLMSGELFLSSL